MKKILGVVFISLFCLVASAQRIIYLKEDSAKVEKLLKAAKGLPKNTNRVLFFAKYFVGVPYVASTLEKGDKETLVVNLHELDCTTFVETVTALALTSKEGKTSFKDYCKCLEHLRYIDGVLNEYPSRLHYFSSWIENNTRKGLVSEINLGLKGGYNPFTAKQVVNINYMSTHSNSYPALRLHPQYVSIMASEEKRMSGKTYNYIPRSALNGGKNKLGAVRDGDILAIVSRKDGLDIAHVGFAVWEKGKIHLFNASYLRHKVVLEPQSLYQYMLKQPNQTGIRVVRILHL